MKNQINKQIMFVVYDGIGNSVFQSQVLRPLLDRLEEDSDVQATLVSFERKKIAEQDLSRIIPNHDRLQIIVLWRPPYIGKLSLWFGVKKLFFLFKKNNYKKVVARGPLAGWLCIKALQEIKNKSLDLTVQARGLCGEEYRYTHVSEKKLGLKNLWHRYIKNTLHNIERDVYRKNTKQNVIIESVSPALKKFLIKTFGADEAQIIIASKDIPKKVDKGLIKAWRAKVRQELGIPQETHIFCYSGSYKPWQCADETIKQFSQELEKDEKAFFLVVTQDEFKFSQALKRQLIPQNKYKVISVQPDDLLHYLSAANSGFMLRKKDIVNWVSRPTKMLEYQAVGLNVIHNNTVGLLADKNKDYNV